jgi:endoglucanase
MRNLFIIVAYLALAITSCSSGGTGNSPSNNNGGGSSGLKLDTIVNKTGMSNDAEPLVKKIYAGWNLGNSLESTGGETAWGNPATTQAMIDMVKNAGFNAVRIPCAWSSHLSDASTYTIDPAWLIRVKQVVDYVVNDGMYAIINIHWDQGWLENNVTTAKQSSANAEQKALWTQIATYFRGYDEHLMFAGCNEPSVSDATGMNVLLTYEQTFINAVRATGGRNYYRNLIVQGPSADIDKTNTLMTTMPTDVVSNRMIAEVHYYTPWQFCGLTADASWGNMFYFWGDYANQPNVDGVNRNATWGNEDYMLTEFAKVKSQFVDKGIPVIAGEFGAIRRTMETTAEQTAHDNSVAEFVEDVTKDAKNAGIAPFLWDNGSFLFDRTNLTTRYPLFLQSIMAGAKAGSYPF